MRVLLVGGGCRGRVLARELVAAGHAVRAVTRTEAGRGAIEEAGAECWIGDPDVIGTLRYALEHVTVLVWALASARGSADSIAALHGDRLQMMLEKAIDSTVRGIVYEAAGPVGEAMLAAGLQRVRATCELNAIPYGVIDAPPDDAAGWAASARAAIARIVGGCCLTRH